MTPEELVLDDRQVASIVGSLFEAAYLDPTATCISQVHYNPPLQSLY